MLLHLFIRTYRRDSSVSLCLSEGLVFVLVVLMIQKIVSMFFECFALASV